MAIPHTLSASQALARAERHAGELSVAQLARIAEFAVPGAERLAVQFEFHRDPARQGWIEGLIRGRLRLQCRVCLADFEWPLDTRLKLAVTDSEAEEARLMEHAEPYLVVEDRVALHEIVEDEVLLAIPMMPRCPACENARPSSGESSPAPAAKSAGLAGLKDLDLKGGIPARGK